MEEAMTSAGQRRASSRGGGTASDDGLDATAEAASKRRCIVSGCSANARWITTSIVRSRSSMFVSPS